MTVHPAPDAARRCPRCGYRPEQALSTSCPRCGEPLAAPVCGDCLLRSACAAPAPVAASDDCAPRRTTTTSPHP